MSSPHTLKLWLAVLVLVLGFGELAWRLAYGDERKYRPAAAKPTETPIRTWTGGGCEL